MAAPDPLRSIVVRWREEARRALPDAPTDVIDEVAEHLGHVWQAAVGAGATPAEADRTVREDLAAWKRPAAEAAPSRWRRLTSGWQTEWRQASRVWATHPSFALGIVGLTALAVAAALTTFAVAYGLLWRPLPYPEADRLAVLWQVQRGEEGQLSLPDFRDLSAATVFDGGTALSGGRGSLRVGEEIDRVNGLFVDPAAFALLGARPQLGRLLTADDAGRDTALISDRVWRRRFGASPSIVGGTIWLSGRTLTVVGVLAPGVDFELPVADRFFLEQHEVWTVHALPAGMDLRRDVRIYEGLVRLRPGVGLREAQAAVDTIAEGLSTSFADTNGGRSFRLVPLGEVVVARMRQPLILGALAALVTLAIALANMLTLVTVRLSGRQTELAVRHALGAGGFRLRRQLLTEHTVLVLVGLAFGLAGARWIVTQLLASTAAHLPRPDAVRFDGPVLAAAAVTGALLVGALTLLPLHHARLADALRKGARVGGGGQRVRRALIAVQLGLALTLAAAGVLLGLSLVRLMAVDPGFTVDGVSAARVSAYATQHAERADVERFVASVVSRLAALPGVARAAAGSSLPLSGQSSGVSVMVEGQSLPAAERPEAGWEFATPGYFETLGIDVRAGRTFVAADRDRAGHVCVINESLARRLFPNGDAVGRRLVVGGGPGDVDWHEVVGVVADVRHHALAAPAEPRVYDLLGQHWGRTVYLVARGESGSAPPQGTSIRRVVAEVDPQAPVFETATLAELVTRSAGPQRLATAVAAGLAFAGLALALAGVAAMTAAAAAQRRREMGVRAALGASPRDVFGLMVRESAVTIAIGAVVGAAGAVAVARLLISRAFGLQAEDVALVVPAVAVLLAVAGIAASLPSARSAAGADPLDAMRAE